MLDEDTTKKKIGIILAFMVLKVKDPLHLK